MAFNPKRPKTSTTSGGSYKEKAEEYQDYAAELEQENAELRDRLGEIAEIANPDSGEMAERFGRMEAAFTALLQLAIAAAGPMMPPEARAPFEKILGDLKPPEDKPQEIANP